MWVQYSLKYRYTIFLLLPFFLLCSKAWAETPDSTLWQQLETNNTIIRYQSTHDLKKFNTKINFGRSRWGIKDLFASDEPNTLLDKLKVKIDALHGRVQEILDMRKHVKKVTINIYSDRKQLNNAYFRIYKKECHIRAWYIYEYNSIYINVNDLHEGMLAHEMAHAIIDHFLTVRPPVASAEILARYVDSHLHE